MSRFPTPEQTPSEPLLSPPYITSAPELPAACVHQNMPAVVGQFGHPDISDGVTNIAMFDIQTPSEEQVCATKYTADLRFFAEIKEPLAPEIYSLVQAKIACGKLSVREFAILAFGVENSTDLVQPALAFVKDDTQFLAQTLEHAHNFGLISLSKRSHAAKGDMPACTSKAIAWQDKRARVDSRMDHIEAFTWLLDVDPATIAEKPTPPLSPLGVLRAYNNAFGGTASPASDMDSEAARLTLRQRYEQELQDKVFFPDPVKALHNLYSQRRMRWQTRKEADAFQSVQLAIESPISTGRADVYTFNAATGPSEFASHQAAARLVLDHIGATNPALLKPAQERSVDPHGVGFDQN